MLLNDRVAIITGSGGGLGLTFAKKFAKEGAKIIITDVSNNALENSISELKSIGAEFTTYILDVTNKEQINDVMANVYNKYGRIDILVNNAGGSLYTPKELEKIEEKHWDLVLNVNLKGTFLCSQAVIPYMEKNKYGKIINLSSIGGRTASIVTGVAYAAAKGGVISFTRRLAKEVGDRGINVNAIAPGTVLSGQRMIDSWESMEEKERDDILRSIPLGRLSTDEEQANVVLFLASELSSYITGAVIDINGGRLMA